MPGMPLSLYCQNVWWCHPPGTSPGVVLCRMMKSGFFSVKSVELPVHSFCPSPDQ
ncbi:hypothetical protein [Streptomyces flavidovirens]|uniref:hypothetical protein n=1 Tax=Streptomyces flavidovirens TaxID=67298 RepID=UPI0036BF495D